MSNNLPILHALPDELRAHLVLLYNELSVNFAHHRYKPAELNAAHFCEIVFRILEWHTSDGKTYTPFGQNIGNFNSFEKLSTYSDSIRMHIPNVIKSIYTIRNKRGVGHIGNGVNPNLMDATLVITCADWVMAEIIRIFHNLTLEEAQKIVDNLVTNRIPIIWQVGDTGRRRILNPPGYNLTAKDKVLLLMYDAKPEPVSVKDLLRWSEYKNPSRFRSEVLPELHEAGSIDYDKETDLVHISKLGLDYAEKNLPHDFEPVN